jgi:G3E family GTPase
MPVAETFSFEDELGQSLSQVAELDTMVTVVDAANFMKDFGSWNDLTDRRMGLSDEDTRNIVDLLVDQVEFANVAIINKTDLISLAELERLEQIINLLNPAAKVLRAREGNVRLDQVLGTELLSLQESANHPQWMSVPRGQEQTETEEYGISSFVYRSRRPFHPQRLSEAIDTGLEGGFLVDVLRSKGLAWIASRNDWAYDWSQAGCSVRINPAGYWWSAAPKEEWPDDEASIGQIRSQFEGPYGDRRQELVFIGQDLDESRICEILDRCLLTDEEMNAGWTVDYNIQN